MSQDDILRNLARHQRRQADTQSQTRSRDRRGDRDRDNRSEGGRSASKRSEGGHGGSVGLRRDEFEDLVRERSDRSRDDDRRSCYSERRADNRDHSSHRPKGGMTKGEELHENFKKEELHSRGDYYEGPFTYEEMQPVLSVEQSDEVSGGLLGPQTKLSMQPLNPGSREPKAMSESARSPRDALNGLPDRKSSQAYAGFDYDAWLTNADNGQLDVYTCLGLQGSPSSTVEPFKLTVEILAALFMQLVIPCLLLLIEMDKISEGEGFSFRPANPDIKFRAIGSAMLLYSLYTMFQNCLSECRSRLLLFVLEHRLSWNICWPLLLGEIARIIVGMVMVMTMYTCFSNASDGTDLVLVAAAFNFLGGIDASFVDKACWVDAIRNFTKVTEPFREALPKDRFRCWSIIIGVLLIIMRVIFVIAGIALAVGFSVLPDRYDESNLWKLPFTVNYNAWWVQ